ncbi:TPA: ShlB/FhaC/HecB family hemolysin secretion/activation protein [Raoultella planticola]|uniref:ShlB/FhaC/HecB family hemolysin secretion/activation protein n=1 Tax=Raoultella planticola TaxID=575 RepID=UPI001A186EF1|nr:ShlB/FhaC/HecB family hemolysin secretion/activation protein [Raoultella planticola]
MKKNNNIAAILLTCLAMCFQASASNNISSAANQNEQDKARQASLAPEQQEYRPAERTAGSANIEFPVEKNCKYIKEIIIVSRDENLTHKLLNKLVAQAKSKCLGIEGIQLLTRKLQNELLVKGYITSLIDIPSQSLQDGTLQLRLTYGTVGTLSYASDESDKTRLWNAMPLSEGDILRLPDLEQGMANLQRTPGSAAQMALLPGQHDGESDIKIVRKVDKSWQVGLWLDDAGSRATGRYQGGGALYLYDVTSLNDTFYVSGGGDVNVNQHQKGSSNASLYYSIPFGYWDFSVYASKSEYLQQLKGQWSSTDFKSKNHHYSATISRMLSHTRTQKTSADLRIFKSHSRYYFGGAELEVMRKNNPGWELTLRHQHYFDKKAIAASLGLQKRLAWLNSSPTPEEKAGLYDKEARVIHGEMQAYMKFDLTGDDFSYAPRMSAQYSPDKLATDNMFNIGSRWSVRGFDGENTLSSSQGWFWRNDLIWDLPLPDQQFYLGLDIGKIIGSDRYQSGKVLSGAVSGLRGEVLQTQYDFFIGTPISRPESFHSDSFNMGFSLQWRY